MQKAQNEVPASNTIVVTVARFGNAPQNVTVPTGSTVDTILATVGLHLEGREELFVEGVNAEGDDVLENGDILSVVTPKQAG